MSMPRPLENNNSVSSNFSVRTSMIASLNAKDKIPEHYMQKIAAEADLFVKMVDRDGVG